MDNSTNLAFIGSPYFASLRDLMNNKVALTTFPKDDIVTELFFISEKAKTEVQIRFGNTALYSAVRCHYISQ